MSQFRDNDLLVVFGRNLRKHRVLKSLTQAQLAADCGFEISQISRIELGKLNTSISHLSKIVEVLDIDYNCLFVKDE
jgi:transcriptional regulator with XRE-family HTH domain